MLKLTGAVGTAEVARLWQPLMQAASSARGAPWVLDVTDAQIGDAGAVLLAAAMARHSATTLQGADPVLFARVVQAAGPLAPAAQPRPGSAAAPLRTAVRQLMSAVAFVGESVVAITMVPRRHRQFRAGDLAHLTEQAGWQAIPLVVLLGTLMGLILAFQSSIPLRRFGADLFVVNMVGLSLLRELGPLLTAVILAGRTGSAFAAELGTMKVNEELAALEVLGLSPMTMLVLPRLVAAVLVMPVLTLMLELAGLCGMLVVMLAFGFPVSAVVTQLSRAVHAHDLWGGLFKAACFGAAVAGIGCRAGLATGIGPRAVGRSATAAVVGGIVAAVVLDGLFAVVFYRIGV